MRRQPDERRVPDRVEDRVLDLGHGPEDKVAGVGEVGRVVGLWRYPVKSMAAEALSSVEVGLAGFTGDRRWAFVRGDVPRSGFPWMTIREDAAMLEHVPRFVEPERPDKSRVMVRTPGGSELDVIDPALAASLGDGVRVIKQDRGVFDAMPLSLITTPGDRGARAGSSASSCIRSGSGPTCSSSPTSARTSGSGASCGSAGWRCGSTSATRAA